MVRFMVYKTLTRNNEFARAYRRGKSLVSPMLVTYVNKNYVGYTKVGITSSKKIGNAVARNRARRVIRAAMLEVLPKNVGGYDIVFVARGITANKKSWQVKEAMQEHLTKLGIIKNG